MSGGLSLTERLEQMVSKKVREIKSRFIIMWQKSCDINLDTWSNYININDCNRVGIMEIVGFGEIQSDP